MTSRYPVMVTRPAHLAASLLSRLTALGFDAIPFPLLTTQALEPRAEELEPVRRLDTLQSLIFISRNAVRHGLPLIHRQWPRLPDSVTCFAVGAGTARELEQAGIAVQVPANPTSEGLLELPALQRVEGQEVLIVRGRGGRELLFDALRARGASVHYLEVYERGGTGYSAEDLDRILGRHGQLIALLTSGAALAELDALISLPQQRRRLRLVVPSARVLELAERAGYQAPVLAEGASDDQMLSALSRLVRAPDPGA